METAHKVVYKTVYKETRTSRSRRDVRTGLMHLWRCLQALSGGLPSKGQGHPLGTRRVDERVSASVVLLWWPYGS